MSYKFKDGDKVKVVVNNPVFSEGEILTINGDVPYIVRDGKIGWAVKENDDYFVYEHYVTFVEYETVKIPFNLERFKNGEKAYHGNYAYGFLKEISDNQVVVVITNSFGKESAMGLPSEDMEVTHHLIQKPIEKYSVELTREELETLLRVCEFTRDVSVNLIGKLKEHLN